MTVFAVCYPATLPPPPTPQPPSPLLNVKGGSVVGGSEPIMRGHRKVVRKIHVMFSIFVVY
jgi:hypothetical protein